MIDIMDPVDGKRIELLCGSVYAKRVNSGRTIRQAAKKIGISPTTLCKIENGHIPDTQTLFKVLSWIGCGLSFFDIEANES